MRRRRIILSAGIILAVVIAFLAMTAGSPAEMDAKQAVAAAGVPASTPTVSASTSLPAPAQQCEERTTYAWKVTPTDDADAKPVKRLLTKGSQASFVQSVTITRSIESIVLWCGPEGSELTQCGVDGSPDCPAGVAPVKVQVDETAELTRKTNCNSDKGFDCLPGPSKPRRLTEQKTVVAHSVTLKNESSACKGQVWFTSTFRVSVKNNPSDAVWKSPKTTADSGPCPKPKPVVKPKPKPKPVVKPAPKPKPVVRWVKATADYWRANPALIGRYLTICLGIEPGHQDNPPTCVSTTNYAQSVLSASNSGDGLARLSAQLLTAKLNLKSGGHSNVGCLAEADRLLDWYKGAKWHLLSAYNQSYVASCANQLSAYNSSVLRRS